MRRTESRTNGVAVWALVAMAAVSAAPAAAQAERAPGAPRSAQATLQGFFEAFNSGDPARMLAFLETGATEAFRARGNPAEDRKLYERLFGDFGTLTVEGLRRRGDRAEAHVRAAKVPDPVVFTFDVVDGRIDGFRVDVGGPPEDDGAVAVDLPADADAAALAQALDRQLRRLAADDAFSGVVLLARDGKPTFLRAYGDANRAKGIPNRKNTRFDIGSITKLLTKIAVAQLLQAGEIREDQTLLEVLPDYPNRDVAARITVGQVIEHRSGLGDIFNDRWEAMAKDRLTSPRDFFPLFVDRPLRFEPGTNRAYSNAGYVVLGAIVETVSGRPYAEYLAENVFAPAGMKRSGFPRRDGTAADVAIGYTRRGGEGPQPNDLEPNLGMLPIRGCPAGSSTHAAVDLLKLDRALRAGKLLDAEWTAWVYTGARVPREEPDYRLGVAGGGPGVSAGFESDGAVTAIVLSNFDPPGGERLALELFDALGGDG